MTFLPLVYITLTLFPHHTLTETLYFVDNMEWNADEDVDDEQLLHALDDVERTIAQVDTTSNVNINTPSTHSQCFSLVLYLRTHAKSIKRHSCHQLQYTEITIVTWKTFIVGESRTLKLYKNGEVKVVEKSSTKQAVFTPPRWAAFVQLIDHIDSQLNEADQGKNIAFRYHYGGWFVSVTSGIACVDLRKFYISFGELTFKPTRTGIAIRLSEWPVLKESIQRVNRDNATAANYVPCYMNQSHDSETGILSCEECNPFKLTRDKYQMVSGNNIVLTSYLQVQQQQQQENLTESEDDVE